MTTFELAITLSLVGILILVAAVAWRLFFGASGEKTWAASERNLADAIAIVKLAVDGARDDASRQSSDLRKEVGENIDRLGRTLQESVDRLGKAQTERLDSMAKAIDAAAVKSTTQGSELRRELLETSATLATQLGERLVELGNEQGKQLLGFGKALTDHRTTASSDAKQLREELSNATKTLGSQLGDTLALMLKRQSDASTSLSDALSKVTLSNEKKQDLLRDVVEQRLDTLRVENSKKLDEMRTTVDEKLSSTLNERLGTTFSQVNENLERVYKSVGEMQTLASGVGDLKRVLSNIKVRGTWGEGTLGTLLEQTLTPDQFGSNVAVKTNSNERVEYAIKLPGEGAPVWLPIDSKLPQEDYERLCQATEAGDANAVELAGKALERSVVKCAQDISNKYISPPDTTDFAIMFLPSEGLFAEVVRRPGLADKLSREYRINVTGPTTITAVLHAFRMGFRTLAIQERSSEVWQVLSSVKTEFGKFGPMLDKVSKKLNEAQGAVSSAQTRSRVLNRHLGKVETLPQPANAMPVATALEELFEDQSQNPDWDDEEVGATE